MISNGIENVKNTMGKQVRAVFYNGIVV